MSLDSDRPSVEWLQVSERTAQPCRPSPRHPGSAASSEDGPWCTSRMPQPPASCGEDMTQSLAAPKAELREPLPRPLADQPHPTPRPQTTPIEAESSVVRPPLSSEARCRCQSNVFSQVRCAFDISHVFHVFFSLSFQLDLGEFLLSYCSYMTHYRPFPLLFFVCLRL